MSARLLKHAHYLKVLNKTDPKTRAAILKNANKELLLCLCECVENILNGNVKITSRQRNQLKQHTKALRQIRDMGTEPNKKKKLLVQKGGFLGALLAQIITGVAGSVLSGL